MGGSGVRQPLVHRSCGRFPLILFVDPVVHTTSERDRSLIQSRIFPIPPKLALYPTAHVPVAVKITLQVTQTCLFGTVCTPAEWCLHHRTRKSRIRRITIPYGIEYSEWKGSLERLGLDEHARRVPGPVRQVKNMLSRPCPCRRRLLLQRRY